MVRLASLVVCVCVSLIVVMLLDVDAFSTYKRKENQMNQ